MLNRKKKILLVSALIVLLAVFAAVYLLLTPHGSRLEKTVVFEVTHTDGEQKIFTLMSDCETLRELLEPQGLISGDDGPYGLYVMTVDGETADEALRQWWCFTRDGEMLMTGVDSTVIADGEHYEAFIDTY